MSKHHQCPLSYLGSSSSSVVFLFSFALSVLSALSAVTTFVPSSLLHLPAVPASIHLSLPSTTLASECPHFTVVISLLRPLLIRNTSSLFALPPTSDRIVSITPFDICVFLLRRSLNRPTSLTSSACLLSRHFTSAFTLETV